MLHAGKKHALKHVENLRKRRAEGDYCFYATRPLRSPVRSPICMRVPKNLLTKTYEIDYEEFISGFYALVRRLHKTGW